MSLFFGLRGFKRNESQIYQSPFLAKLPSQITASRTLLEGCVLTKGIITLAEDRLVIISLNFLELSQVAQQGQI